MHALGSAARKPANERPKIVILLDALRSTRPSKDAQGERQSPAQPSTMLHIFRHQLV